MFGEEKGSHKEDNGRSVRDGSYEEKQMEGKALMIVCLERLLWGGST